MALASDHMDDLIGKVLAGEATAAETLEVERWRQEDAEHEKYYHQVSILFEKAAATPVQVNFDTDQAWKRVKQRLAKEPKVVPLKPAFAYWPVLRIAAGILLVLAAGVFAYQWLSVPTESLAVVSNTTTVQDTLPDGSTAFLNKRSSISYEYNPRKGTRQVQLKGEGFFEVKHEETKPFVIETEGVFVRDIGTAFNVKSYPDKDTVEVIVQSGEVQFYTLRDPGLFVNAGETGIYSKRARTFTKLTQADTNALAYKTGVFSFHSTDLRSVIDRLNDVYDSKITLSDPLLGNCRLTATFVNEDIETVLEVIAETMSLEVERKEEREFVLRGTGCE